MKILNKIKGIVIGLLNVYDEIKIMKQKIDLLQKSVGRVESYQKLSEDSNDIHKNEFQVYSQWGEDGIIQFLINKVPIEGKIFVEFGVENYLESNTRFLLQNNNWAGLVIDSLPENIKYIKNDQIYWRYKLKAECSFIDKDNINSILRKSGISGDIGLLSIDIDGNDYWVWEAIECVNPRIVICEYNSTFGYKRKVVIPYDKNFEISKAHFSYLYYGASIAALTDLAKKKGYELVGSNSNGCNVFFVRKDLVGDLPIYSVEQAYIKAKFRNSRDEDGNLSFLDFEQRLNQISELPLYDLDLGVIIKVEELSQKLNENQL
ncbi:MAG TPA: hypothetical protein V6D12_25260 [Candidatus Obscuribacterales bacterium]